MKTSKNCRTVLLLLLALSMVSCGNGVSNETQPNDGGTVTLNNTETETETEPETEDPNQDNLPEGLNYDGYNFRVLTYEGGNIEHKDWKSYIDVEEVTGEGLNDAAYNRNTRVEKRLNVTISCIEQGGGQDTPTILKNSVLSDQDEYDYSIYFSTANIYQLIAENCAYNINELEYVDLSKPYYLQSVKDTFTINGKLYYLTGDAVCTMRGSSYIFYNVPLWQEYKLEDPYEIVRSGKWTLEKCFSLIEGTYKDLNGDGIRDMNDRYGINGIPVTMGYCYLSCGGEYFKTTADGYELSVDSERNVTLVDDLLYHMNNENAYFVWDDSYSNMFRQGRSLMFFSGNAVTLLRDMEFQSGLLPFPKYNEDQEKYLSVMAGGLTIVPITISDADRTGAILEALNSESADVKEAFYQQYVENKVLQDEGSQEMFRLILENGVYDFTYYIDPMKRISNRALFVEQLEKNQNNLVSSWKSVQKLVKKGYDQFFDSMK